LRQHVLPAYILRAVSYDLDDINEVMIRDALRDYADLSASERRHFLQVADYAMDEELSNPIEANNRALDEWVARI
jgi:hypothetical protein